MPAASEGVPEQGAGECVGGDSNLDTNVEHLGIPGSGLTLRPHSWTS